MNPTFDAAIQHCARILRIRIIGEDVAADGWWIMGPNGKGWIGRQDLYAAGDEQATIARLAEARDRLALPKHYRFRIRQRKLRM